MTVLTPTKDKGAVVEAGLMVNAEPDRIMLPEALEGLFPESGLNAPFVADLLSAFLAHERCGRHLYRTCETRTQNPVLKAKYREFGSETERHVEILEQLIGAAGGNPNYVSSHARAVEGTDSKLVESTFMVNGTLDVMTAEMAMLDAVFIAESVDHANWQAMRQLSDSMKPGGLHDAFLAAVEEVEQQEDEHLQWAHDTRAKLTLLQAQSSTLSKAGMKAEELVAQVKNWFSE
jgi:hypothetical protein